MGPYTQLFGGANFSAYIGGFTYIKGAYTMRGVGFNGLGKQYRLIFGGFDFYIGACGFTTILGQFAFSCVGAGEQVRFWYSTTNYGLEITMRGASFFARLVSRGYNAIYF